MNLLDLPELMREHSERDAPPVLNESRIDSVRRKVAGARRRREVVSLLATVAAIALVGLSLPLTRTASTTPETPAHGPLPSAVKTINGFPEYADGGHVVATKAGSLRGGALTLTVVPDRLDFTYTNTCPSASSTVEIWLELTVNGHDEGGMTCGATAGDTYGSDDPSYWATIGMRVGEPATFTFTPKAYKVALPGSGILSKPTAMALPDDMFSVAVLQRVPFDQYQLPPRPATLPTLDVSAALAGSYSRVVDSNRTNPLAAQTLTVTFPDCSRAGVGNCLKAVAMSQTPGYLEIIIDGVTVSRAEFWTYQGDQWSFGIDPTTGGLHLRAGDMVTITIIPQYLTGAWQFGVDPVSN